MLSNKLRKVSRSGEVYSKNSKRPLGLGLGALNWALMTGHSWRLDRLVASADGGAEDVIPEPRGDAEVSALRRIMMAHMPGAQLIEIHGRGSIGAVMDDVMNHAVPPIAEHDANGEAVGDVESRVQPNGNQKAAG